MIARYCSYEAAGIFAGLMRSEGHYSAVLAEHSGFMWGASDPIQDGPGCQGGG
jgi:hypothetical protein